MSTNSAAGRKVEKTATGAGKTLTQGVHTPPKCGLHARGGRRGGPSRGTDRLWLKVGQDWLQGDRGNRWNKDMEGGPRQGAALFNGSGLPNGALGETEQAPRTGSE